MAAVRLGLLLSCTLLLSIIQSSSGAAAPTPLALYRNHTGKHARETQSFEVEARGRQLQPFDVHITGLVLPTFLTLDDTGAMLIAEKAGIVKRMVGLQGNAGPETTILDIQGIVANYGDHGLMSIVVYQGFLWAAFSRETPPYGDNCADFGAWNGRPGNEINGCKVYGRISRWPFANGAVTGPEQIVIDGEQGNVICGQFSTHGTTMILVGPGGYLYFSVGDGAAFTAPDYGQMGNNPCNDPPAFLGAFRVQNPEKLNGKVMRLDPQTLEIEIYAVGFRNPFRLMYWEGNLYETDTGWYTAEEMNLVLPNHNYGWPCFEGAQAQLDYAFLNHATCAQLAQNNLATPPLYQYDHPQGAVENVQSISAIAGWNGRIFVGDYTQGLIWSIAPDGTDYQLVHRNAAPVGLFPTPAGLLYINYDLGMVLALPAAGAPLPSASPSPAPPAVTITPGTPTWNPGSQVTLQGTTNIEGREGLMWEWSVSLLVNCRQDDSCDVAQLIIQQAGTNAFTFNTPSAPGTLEVVAVAKTYSGAQVRNVMLYPSNGMTPCTCNGQRNQIDPNTIGGIRPSQSSAPSALPSWGRVPSPMGAGNRGRSITDSPAFLGGVIAAAAVVSIGIVIGAAWMTGLTDRLGITSRSSVSNAAGGDMRPPRAPATANGTAAANTNGTQQRDGSAPPATQPSSLAARRPSFNGAPALNTRNGEAGAVAAPQAGVTPAGEAAANATQSTPVGGRKV